MEKFALKLAVTAIILFLALPMAIVFAGFGALQGAFRDLFHMWAD